MEQSVNLMPKGWRVGRVNPLVVLKTGFDTHAGTIMVHLLVCSKLNFCPVPSLRQGLVLWVLPSFILTPGLFVQNPKPAGMDYVDVVL